MTDGREVKARSHLSSEDAKTTATFWQWQYSVASGYFTALIASIAIGAWFFQSSDLKPWLFVPFAMAAIFSVLSAIVDRAINGVHRECYHSAPVSKDDSSTPPREPASSQALYPVIFQMLYIGSAIVFSAFAVIVAVTQGPLGNKSVTLTGDELIMIGDTVPLVELREGSELATRDRYAPPVKITYQVMTDSTNVRLRYAADQIIFNWEEGPKSLRIIGGPAGGQHVSGGGGIPANEFVTITQVVGNNRMTISVDGVERAVWDADFSNINEQIRIFPRGSILMVRSITVEKLKNPDQGAAF